MRNIRNIFLLNRYFFLGFLFYLLASVSFLLITSKADSFLYLTSYHNHLLDSFFIGYTNLGDGIFTIIIVVSFLIARRFEFAWQLLAAYIVSGLLAQLLKHLVFSPRPKEFFAAGHIHLINGVTLTGTSSFPSGHTASIFALATLLSLFSKNKKIGCLYLLGAILVGFSRIYLSQHFPVDVFTGSVIGVFVAVWVYSFFNNRLKGWPVRRLKERKAEAAS